MKSKFSLIILAALIIYSLFIFEKASLKREPQAEPIVEINSPSEESSDPVAVPQEALANEGQETRITSDIDKKVQVFESILESKNDNDPRLDLDLKNLSEEFKSYLKTKYRSLSQELRNEKGLIVFLLGRNLATEEDVAFMDEVLSEPECLSLSNCSQVEELKSHHQETNSITLAYPQIVALQMLSKAPRDLRSSAQDVIHKAKNSKVLMVSQKAQEIDG